MMEELREMSRGLHPAILSEGGLSPALRTLAQRSAVPVELHVNTKSRYPPPLEVAAVLRRLRGTHQHDQVCRRLPHGGDRRRARQHTTAACP